ncbi:MAG TPA: hypothetical protein VHK63_07345 [Candidatus Limnocylindria bacterium]|nr:hypothetical protein [Candidatus Limnocylindria bacterium]
MARPPVTIAVLPYAVRRLDAGIRRLLFGFGGVPLLVAGLLAVAVVPPVVEAAEQQPLLQSVDDLRDGVSSLSSWVRMNGRIVTLSSPEDVEAGREVRSLLVEPSGDAIMLLSSDPVDHLNQITGRLSTSSGAEDLAARIGGPRFPADASEVIDGYVVRVDNPVVPAERKTWLLSWGAVLAAGLLLLGRRLGYPMITLRRGRASRPPDDARPLAVGEEVTVRVVDAEEEQGTRLSAPPATLLRLPRVREADPYFEMRIPGQPRPTSFKRHRWALATPGTLRMVAERLPIVHLHDWSVEVVLAVSTEAERDRLLASFARAEDEPATDAEQAPSEKAVGA